MVLLVVLHLDVEVAQPLEVIAQAAVALIQQIFVDRTLFKDRNQPLQPFAANLGSFNVQRSPRDRDWLRS